PFNPVGPVVVLPAALLLLSSAPGRRPAGAGHRGTATAAVVLVLLPERPSVLSDRSNVPRGVDQGPAAGTVDTRRADLEESASDHRPPTAPDRRREGARLERLPAHSGVLVRSKV